MNNSDDSNQLADQILRTMPRLSRLLSAHLTALTENEGTMMQMAALHMLMEHPMTTSELAQKRHVSLQAASNFVQGLVERGWVIRVNDPTDRRRSIIEVTDAGREQEMQIRQQMTTYLSGLLTALTRDEHIAAQHFFDGLNRIIPQYIAETLHHQHCDKE